MRASRRPNHRAGLRLATTLEQVGPGGADCDELMTVARTAVMPAGTIHNMPFPIDAAIACDAMVAADAKERELRDDRARR